MAKVQMIVVASSNIEAIGHTENVDKKETLFIRFKNGSCYEYQDVPLKIYTDFLNSESKGRYFHQHISGQYSFTKL